MDCTMGFFGEFRCGVRRYLALIHLYITLTLGLQRDWVVGPLRQCEYNLISSNAQDIPIGNSHRPSVAFFYSQLCYLIV